MKNLKSIQSPTRFYKVVDAVDITHKAKIGQYSNYLVEYIIEENKTRLLSKSELLDCKNALENLDVWSKGFWNLSIEESISAIAVPTKSTKIHTLKKIEELLIIL